MSILLPIYLFVFGSCVGSFLNVVVWRMPRGESIAFPGSRCPKCGEAIKWYDNIPILSWSLLRGRCRSCGESISVRYPIIEGVTGMLVLGLYLCYYVFDLREAVTTFELSWPVFAAHAILACGLLACSIVDIECWQVPLEICWLISACGMVVATFCPASDAWIPQVAASTSAMTIGAVVGLVISVIMQRRGMIEPSFIDASPDSGIARADEEGVAFTSSDGINPRVEILREVLFLTPAMIGALLAYVATTHIPAVAEPWQQLLTSSSYAPYINGFLASLFGYIIGGLWIWGARIVGTLCFGKEAMGLGDVHILAAAGAVGGWAAPTIAFFVAPLLGIAWAVCLATRRGQRELPYGPWLSIASLAALIFYDWFVDLFRVYCQNGKLM